MYDDILVPTDGSEGTKRAIEQAIGLAEAFDARIHALYVVDQRFPAASKWDMVVEEQETEGERALDSVASQASDAGLEVERVLRRGVPHEEILDYATDEGVDIIIMGTHGRTGFDRFVTAGSVTERVVRFSEVPVLTARLTESAE